MKNSVSGQGISSINKQGVPPRALMEGRKAVDELQLKYIQTNKKDINWLASILGEILRYPSADLAERHRKANKLGSLDMKTPQQISKDLQEASQDGEDLDAEKKNSLTVPQARKEQKMNKKFMKRCKCCGLVQQDAELSLQTDIWHVNHIGMSTSLYFMTLKNLYTLLLIMVFVFSLFAVVTNFHTSQLYKNSLQGSKQVDQKANTFKGILAISLGSKFYEKSEYTQLTFAAQCWLGTMTVLIWAFAFVYIKKIQKEYEYKVDFSTTSAGDFSVLVSNIPIQYYDANLQALFQQSMTQYTTKMKKMIPDYEQIFKKIDEPIKVYSVNRVSLVNLERYFNQQNDLGDQQLKKYQEELKQLEKQWIELIEHRKKNKQFKKGFSEIQKMEEVYSNLRKQKRKRYKIVSKQKAQKKIQKIQQKRKFDSFFAFVTFDHTQNKELIQRLHERQKSLIHKLPCASKRKYLTLQTNDDIEIQVKVEAAPEPEDIIWANYNMTQWNRRMMKIITFSLTLVALAISFILVFLISQVQAVISESEKKQKGLITTVLSGAISLVLFVINYMLTEIINRSTKMERNITYTREQTSIGVKSILAVLVNSIAVPLVVNKIITDNLYGVDGLADVVFFQALTSALLTPVLKVFNPSYIIYRVKRWWHNRPEKRLYLSQKQLNKCNQEPQFEIGSQYVEVVAMFLFACFYASLQPIIVLIAVFGLFLMTYAQRISLYRLSKRPTPGDSDINSGMYYFIFAGPLFYSFGSFCLDNIYGNFRHGIIPNTLAIILSLFIFLAPYDQIVRFLIRNNKQIRSSTYTKDRVFLTSQYARLNPQTKQQAEQQYNTYFQNFLKTLKSKNKKQRQQIQQKFEYQNMYGTGEQQQQQQQQQEEDQPYFQILINNTDTDLMIKQYEQLQQFLQQKAKDPIIKDIPYYVYAGDYNNENIIITEHNMEDFGEQHKQDVDYDFNGYNLSDYDYNLQQQLQEELAKQEQVSKSSKEQVFKEEQGSKGQRKQQKWPSQTLNPSKEQPAQRISFGLM